MNDSVTLFFYQDAEIKISIDAYFEGEVLVIDGYDIGSKVKEYWGDSDYEYVTRIPAAGVQQLYVYYQLDVTNKAGLLQQLAANFNTNTCYSDINKLLTKLAIASESFTWV